LGGGCATLLPPVSFTAGTPSSIFVQTVCCKRIGLLILILSWWSPLNAMDLCLASLHLGLLLGESLGPSTLPLLKTPAGVVQRGAGVCRNYT